MKVITRTSADGRKVYIDHDGHWTFDRTRAAEMEEPEAIRRSRRIGRHAVLEDVPVVITNPDTPEGVVAQAGASGPADAYRA